MSKTSQNPFTDPAFCRAVLPHAQKLASLGLWEYRPLENRLHWSEETFKIFGVAQEKFGGRGNDFTDRLHPEDRDAHRTLLEEADRGGLPHHSRYRVRLPNGEHRWVEERGEAERNADGVVTRRFGVVRALDDTR